MTIWRGRQWKVTSSGINTHDNKYFIAKTRVWENEGTSHTWEDHMEEKGWADMNDFRRALAEARRRWPRKS